MEIEKEDILRKNLVKQISQAEKLCAKWTWFSNFIIANNFLALLPLFVKKV